MKSLLPSFRKKHHVPNFKLFTQQWKIKPTEEFFRFSNSLHYFFRKIILTTKRFVFRTTKIPFPFTRNPNPFSHPLGHYNPNTRYHIPFNLTEPLQHRIETHLAATLRIPTKYRFFKRVQTCSHFQRFVPSKVTCISIIILTQENAMRIVWRAINSTHLLSIFVSRDRLVREREDRVKHIRWNCGIRVLKRRKRRNTVFFYHFTFGISFRK